MITCTRRFSILASVWILATPAFAIRPPGGGAGDAHRDFDARREWRLQEGPVAATPVQREALERLRRDVPDLAATLDPDSGVTRSLSNRAGFLTPATELDALAVGRSFMEAHLTALGLAPGDVAGAAVVSDVPTRVSGARRVSLGQRHAGLAVHLAYLQFNVNRDGRLISVKNSFTPGLAAAVNSTVPTLTARQAVEAVALHLGSTDAGEIRSLGREAGSDRKETFSAPGLSLAPIEVALAWLPIRAGEVRLVWNLVVDTLDHDHQYALNVDAADGRIWTRWDRVDNATYRVYPRPLESPDDAATTPPADGRTEVTDPFHAAASPFGWHDTNGVPGAEFTFHRGNNTHAWSDRDADELPPAVNEPDCGAALDCDFPIDLTEDPVEFQPAAVTNLFYWTNYIHDVEYLYGFDEAATNFQVNNYGNGGMGGDDVRALAQAKTGDTINCNANFLTPAEGSRPRMRMYECDEVSPLHDGDLDAIVIAHEYGHGISNRTIANSSSVDCLGNDEQWGEGTSDWWALSLTMRPGDQGTDARGVGNYLFGLPLDGPGIRGLPYSTDESINDWTYADVAGAGIPHGVGSRWAQAYWEVTWALIDEHGFNPEVTDFALDDADEGNIRAKFYLMEGIKNTVCNPGFVDLRDGILEAATDNYGGDDVCLLWAAFAGFGLGDGASQGSSGSTNDQTPSFELPDLCAPASTTTTLSCSPNPSLVTELVTCTATVTATTGTPGGELTFLVDGGGDVVVELDAGGQASFSTDLLTVGAHSIDASYGGETFFLPSAAAPFAQTVERIPTAVSVVAVPNPVEVGNQFLLTATVANASALPGTPTGSVIFTIDGVDLAPIAIDGAGVAELAFAWEEFDSGDHLVEVRYLGDAMFTESQSAGLVLEIEASVLEIPVLSPAGLALFVALLAAAAIARSRASAS